MSPARASASSCCSCPSSTGAWAAARSTSTGSASGWPRSTSASRPPSSRRSWAATRSGSAAPTEQKREYMTRIAKEGVAVRLRRHRARGRQRPRRAEDDRRAGRATTAPSRLPDQRRQAVDQQRRRRRPLHDPGASPRAGRAGSWSTPAPRASRTANPEDKHGIRLSNTAALFLDEVYVDADRLIGGVEGQGLVQAQQVFGYTRLMVAAFGLGAGWAALDRAIAYSAKRIQAGGPLSEKQGYTHKLIVPHAVALEAARADDRGDRRAHRRGRGRA